MKTSESTSSIASALAKAQAEIKTAIKDATNPHFKSRYADLVAIVESCRPALSKNGIAVIQGGEKKEGSWVLTTRLAHSSGEWYECDFPLLARDNSAQAMGSATTYAKRYALAAMVGVVADDEDDDGEGAMGRIPQKKQPVKPTQDWDENFDSPLADSEDFLRLTKLRESLKMTKEELALWVVQELGIKNFNSLSKAQVQTIEERLVKGK